MPQKWEIKEEQDRKKRAEIKTFLETKDWTEVPGFERYHSWVVMTSPKKNRRIYMKSGVLSVVDYDRKKSGMTPLSLLLKDIDILPDSLRADYIELYI